MHRSLPLFPLLLSVFWLAAGAGGSTWSQEARGELFIVTESVTAYEEHREVVIGVARNGGSWDDPPIPFEVVTTDGTAKAGSDYLPLTQTHHYIMRNGTMGIRIPLLDSPGTDEAGETFTVSLRAPAGSNTVIARPWATATEMGSSARVLIVDSVDDKAPPPPVITRPAANASFTFSELPSMVVTGVASDNKGVEMVEVGVNGFVILADLNAPRASRTGFSATLPASPGLNIITVRSVDTRSNYSREATRTFRARMRVPLTVNHDASMGTVTPAFAGTTLRDVGVRYSVTAIPKKKPVGAVVFDRWTVKNVTLEEIGVTEEDLIRPTLNFKHAPHLVLTAHFAPNRFREYAGTYVAQLIELHHGVLRRDIGANGFFTATVQPTGAFSARIWFDGQVYPVSGRFGRDLRARFSPNRQLRLPLPRPGKPPLMAEFLLGQNPRHFCQCSITEAGADIVSYGASQRAVFDGITRVVPAELLGPRNTPGAYTALVEPYNDPYVGFTYELAEAPIRVPGFGNMTLSANGKLTFAGRLSDDTAVTASTFMTEDGSCPFFVPLYGGKGHLTVGLRMAVQGGTPSSISEENWWVRPPLDTQHYPNGWPRGLSVTVPTQKFAAVPGQSIFSTNSMRAPEPVGSFDNGNMYLYMSYPDTDILFIRGLNVDTTDTVAKIPVDDPTCTLFIDRKTGRISGEFNKRDGTRPSFQGMICDSSGGTAASGYFLTVAPGVKDYTGRAGRVDLAINASTTIHIPGPGQSITLQPGEIDWEAVPDCFPDFPTAPIHVGEMTPVNP